MVYKILEQLNNTESKLIRLVEICGFAGAPWKQEICNSYLLVGGKRITNARTEGFNNLVKVIKRCGYGYSNFKRFRNRILHIQKSNNKIKLF